MDTRILVAGGTLAGLAVGAAGGYYLAKKRYEQAFVEALKQAVDEEVAHVEEHYRILTKRGEYSDPETVLARRVPGAATKDLDDSVVKEEQSVEELEQILDKMKYKPWGEGDTPLAVKTEEALKYWNPAGTNGDSRIIGQPKVAPMIRESSEDPGQAYQITEEAFFQGDEEYEQVDLVFYAGDPEPTLAGYKDDEPWEQINTIGRELKLEDFGDGTTLYFRNPRTRTEFEVSLSEHAYSEYVAGIEPEAS